MNENHNPFISNLTMTVLTNFAVFSFLVAGTTQAALFKPLEMNKWGDGAKKVDPVEIVNILVDGEKKGAISILEAKMFADDMLIGNKNKKIKLSGRQMDSLREIFFLYR